MRDLVIVAVLQALRAPEVTSLFVPKPLRIRQDDFKLPLSRNRQGHAMMIPHHQETRKEDSTKFRKQRRGLSRITSAAATFCLCVAAVVAPPALAKGGGGGGIVGESSSYSTYSSPSRSGSSSSSSSSAGNLIFPSSYSTGYRNAQRDITLLNGGYYGSTANNYDGPTFVVNDVPSILVVLGFAVASAYFNSKPNDVLNKAVLPTVPSPLYEDGAAAKADGVFDAQMGMGVSGIVSLPTSGVYRGSTAESDGAEQAIFVSLEFAPDGTMKGNGDDSDDGSYTIEGKWTKNCAKWEETYLNGPNGRFTTIVRGRFESPDNLDCRFVSSKGIRGQFILGRFLSGGAKSSSKRA
jgi:hypothetical protein